MEGSPRRARRKLSTFESAWCARYLNHFNGALAVREVRPDLPHERSFKVAHRLLRRPRVRRYLEAWLATKRVPSLRELQGELGEIAVAPWREFVTIRRDTEGNVEQVKLDLRHKLDAIKTLGKWLGAEVPPTERKIQRMVLKELTRMQRASRQGTGGTDIPSEPFESGAFSRSSPASAPRALSPGRSDPLLADDVIDAEVVGAYARETRPGGEKGKGKRRERSDKGKPRGPRPSVQPETSEETSQTSRAGQGLHDATQHEHNASRHPSDPPPSPSSDPPLRKLADLSAE